MQSVKAGTRPPWVGFAAAVWVGIAAGNSYCFPLYSHALKSVLGFTQQQLTVLGVANDLGENTGILPGIAFLFLGMVLFWLAITQTVQNLPYWILWIALVLAANSSAWLGTAVIVTNLRNFPLSRGTVAGLLKRLHCLKCRGFHRKSPSCCLTGRLQQSCSCSHSVYPRYMFSTNVLRSPMYTRFRA
uniref:Putative nodulin-like protein n=1 Tax=Helianthus annuus TaxID=4232 RepID=A0A251USJ4_HELAN